MKSTRTWAIALLSGLSGAVVAVGLASVVGIGSETTTVVRQAPLSSSLEPAKGGGALTARDIYKRDAPGVVFVRAEVVQQTGSPFGLPQQQRGEATGSGFVIDKQGMILTNAHVVDGASKVTVQFQDQKTVDAKILGKDRSTDLAVLQVDPSGLELAPLALGSARDVQVGDPVVAIGNPFGLDRTLTTGVVSAKARQIRGLNGFTIANVIQTDAAINPGNSGGPLIDAAGEVIGINSQIATGGNGNGNVGIGFAVPIDTARKLLPELKKGTISTGYLGVSGVTVDSKLAGLNLPTDKGVLVTAVEPGGPAAKAGIRGGKIPAQIDGQDVQLGGDIITEVDGKPITSSESLAAAISAKRKGDEVKVTALRDGKRRTVSVTLAARPQGTPTDQAQAVPLP
ncbi:MAG: trypsin-like peptidase domain-containing protein [Solirubrobacteraceae bacterium]|nr:trypsin-like peptidase domain-containing protein [Solirubrobacteraceae bacterium]